MDKLKMAVMKEIWKDIEGFEGLYQASSLGRIKSLDREASNAKGNYTEKGRIFKGGVNSEGYIVVTFRKNGEKITKGAHRLVGIAHIPNPNNLPQINHKNGIKTDNEISNLEWCSRSQNQIHAYKTGLQKPTRPMLGRKGKYNPRSRAVVQVCINTGIHLNSFVSATEAHSQTGVSRSKITSVCSGKRKTSGGFKWRYANE